MSRSKEMSTETSISLLMRSILALKKAEKRVASSTSEDEEGSVGHCTFPSKSFKS